MLGSSAAEVEFPCTISLSFLIKLFCHRLMAFSVEVVFPTSLIMDSKKKQKDCAFQHAVLFNVPAHVEACGKKTDQINKIIPSVPYCATLHLHHKFQSYVGQ